MTKNQPVPIFVMGTARSGTTWLANILSSHSEVAAVTAPEHHGIHESHVYDYTRYCFPSCITCKDFISRYMKEDYYKILGIDGDKLCCNDSAEHTVIYWFRSMMDLYASRNNKSYWIEKTPKHTIYFNEIADDFPDAYFVAITRDFLNTIMSNLMKYPRKNVARSRQIIEKVFRFESDMRAIQRMKKIYPNRTIVVNYQSLLSDYQNTIKEITEFVGLGDEKLSSGFSKDSSFSKNTDMPVFTLIEKILIYLSKSIFRIVPFTLLEKLRMIHDKRSTYGIPRSSRLS